MSKLLDTIDELNRGRDFVKVAYMAAQGLEPDEANAMARVLGAAEDSLESVKGEPREDHQGKQEAQNARHR
jgi:hypothetical protein